MNRISKVTRRDIRRIFAEELSGPRAIMPYYGCLGAYAKSSGEVAFLSRLYDLHHMDARDDRSSSAYEELRTRAHLRKAVKDPTWFFEDNRFRLREEDGDEPLLRLVAEVFYPEIRAEEMPWKTYLSRFNALLRPDGYELYPADSISNRSIYQYREYARPQFPQDLFSIRYNKIFIDEKMAISSSAKEQLCMLLLNYNESIPTAPNKSPEKFTLPASVSKEAAFTGTIAIKHPIISFLSNSIVCEELMRHPLSVHFDLIELQYDLLSEDSRFAFQEAINKVLSDNHIPFQLTGRGMMEPYAAPALISPAEEKQIENISEPHLKELVQRAVELHRLPEETSRKEAVEKIWDALERLKTYYVEEPKKDSAQQLIQNISGGQEEIRTLLDEEFQKLTKIGNTFFIRHSETDQIIPADIRHYDYFFNRCLSLILLAIPYLEESEAPHDGL